MIDDIRKNGVSSQRGLVSQHENNQPYRKRGNCSNETCCEYLPKQIGKVQTFFTLNFEFVVIK